MNQHDFSVYIFPDNKKLREDMLVQTASLFSGLDVSLFKKAVDEKGKPYFSGLENIHFSISHSGAYWACAFGTDKVGLDLQKIEECRRKNIAKRFFHPDENEYLKSSDYSPEEFFTIWVKKESYVKYLGQGMPHGFENFSVQDLNKDYELRLIPFYDDYRLCLCSEIIKDVKLFLMDEKIIKQ